MTYSLGQTVELDYATTPAETGTLVVTRPDGTAATATLSGLPGAQVALVNANQTGTWTYLWESPNAGQTAGTFTVGASLVTLADAKRVAPQAPTQATADYEADLSRMIDAVTRHLVVEYGAPMPGTKTKTAWQQGGTVILPLGARVVSVNSGAVSLSGWEHDEDAGLLHGVYSYGRASVTYTVPVLPDVREAALLVIQHAWETRWGANPVPFQSGIDETYTASRGFFVPNRAKELLAPYGTRVA